MYRRPEQNFELKKFTSANPSRPALAGFFLLTYLVTFYSMTAEHPVTVFAAFDAMETEIA